MFESNVFEAKIVNDEAELDGMPFVAPKPRCRGSFIVAFSNKVGSKKIMARMRAWGRP